MATSPSDPDTTMEFCSTCDRETLHEVRVEIRTESKKEENAAFSREPYRISRCVDCDVETTTRMNNA
ncbi:MAG: hypothetical protein ACQETB_11915 [Halobacteriota archaeon]